MTGPPLVSILLPVRDGEATLPDCIASLGEQTLAEWECLAVDDHSTDSTRDILEAWAASDPRVRVLSAPDPGGIVAALETAREQARAPFLARQDADDRSLPERLERQAAALAADPEAAVIGCLTRIDGEPTVGMQRYLSWLDHCTDAETFAREIWIECAIAHPTAAMRVEAIERVGGYREMGWPEDYDLWLRIHLAGGRMYNLDKRLYIWADRPGRLSRTDPRYSPEAFLRCKLRHLREWLAQNAPHRPLVIWGAGRDGRRLARAWETELRGDGHGAEPISAFIDIDPRKLGRERRGRPVLSLPDARRTFPHAFYLVAVGVPGARDLIRGELSREGLMEEADYLCMH